MTERAESASPTGVHDEISPLRRVIVHRPGPELERLTPDSREELLFDEVLWRGRAEAQHREFTSLLEADGVEVLELTRLLTDLLELPEPRARLLEERSIPRCSATSPCRTSPRLSQSCPPPRWEGC